MASYKELYIHLFGALATAVEMLEHGEAAQAKALLIAAQQEAEEQIMAQDELPDTPLCATGE
ncbi:MAG: hypothetical protein E7443_01465 [Ruminococcaceae bacterium]|nr:hypothetical protein [Oscillospiraceae bacterium]